MAETKIEWTATVLPDGSTLPGFSFNCWTGCSKVSPACDHCYAESWAKRSGLVQWGNHPRRRTSAAYWKQPLKWNRIAERDGVRRKVFCASLADVFDNKAPDEWRADLFALIRKTPWLDWLVLTKRPQNIRKMLPGDWGNGWPNVWIGCTTENQEEADRRIPHLLAVPAKVHFLSVEPLLGPVDILHVREQTGFSFNALSRKIGISWRGAGIDWVITGGESGPHARPSHPDWFRSLRDQCAAAGVPFFIKQMTKKAPIPDEFMVREFPP